MFPLSDPVLIFTILMLTILGAPLVGQRLRVPDLVLLLAVGALVGPNGFGILERSTAVTLFGSIGLLYIMFLAGLEIDLHRFIKTGRSSITFGLLTFAIPMTLGSLAGRHLLGFGWPASLLMASLFASHTLLAYPIASRLGITRSEPVTATVGATIITDTLALLVLAVIADMARGDTLDLWFWAGISGGMVGLILLTWLGIPRLTRWFFTHVTEEGGAQFLFVIVVMSGCAYLSHYAKMEPIIGAFLAGAAFNRLIPEHSALMSRVHFAGNSLFIPFFLISVGMLVDPGALVRSPRSWVVAGVMVAAVCGTKLLAVRITGLLFGYHRAERGVMFGLSVVQAAATLAAVLIGYELGIFDETVFNGAIAMIMVTCPLGAWMVERYGPKLAESAVQPVSETGTHQRMLVSVTNPDSARRLLDMAFMLRDESLPGGIFPVTVVGDDHNSEEAVARGEGLLAHCLAHAASVNMRVDPALRVDINPADGIIHAAKELRATSVLAGWSARRGAADRIFGTLSQRLIASCPPRLFLCHLVRPLNTTRRLLLVVPALATQRRYLPPLIADVKHFAKEIGARLCVYTGDARGREIETLVQATQPEVPLQFIACETMTEMRTRMLDDVGEDDTVLLPAERNSSLLWTPTHAKLSGLLLSRYPANNLLICYPALSQCVTEEAVESVDVQQGVCPLVPCELAGVATVDDALRAMVSMTFADTPLGREADALLAHSLGAFPVAMGDDAVLLHAHCRECARALVLVGHAPVALEIEKLSSPRRIVLALISPRSSSPEQHLGRLAWLGRRFNDEEALAGIAAAGSAAQVCRVVGGEGDG